MILFQSSKEFLPTVVDVIFLWIKFNHFSSLFIKNSMFTLAISCLTISNLPWFMNLIFCVPMQYCSLQHQTLLSSPVTSTTDCSFCFGSHFLSVAISPPFFSTILGTYWTISENEIGVYQGSILSPCLFNFHAEYLMWNAGLDKAKAEIKISGTNINNLRYADDTTLIVESD